MFSEKDGLPRKPFPNGWKGENGLYAVGFTKRGLLGASMDAKRIAEDIERSWKLSIAFGSQSWFFSFTLYLIHWRILILLLQFFFFSFLFVRFNGKKVYSDKIFPILSTWYIRNFTFGMLPARIKPNLHNRIREYTSLQTD